MLRLYIIFAFFIPKVLLSQNVRLDETIDKLTYSWDLEADKLATYEGLLHLCGDGDYRNKIFNLLDSIHHYDTVLYQVLINMNQPHEDKEVKKTLKDIKKLEGDFNSREFIAFMRQECLAAKEIEKNAENTRNQVGYNSYSSQVYMLENELYKYVKHITKRVDHIRNHVHHLSSHYEN